MHEKSVDVSVDHSADVSRWKVKSRRRRRGRSRRIIRVSEGREGAQGAQRTVSRAERAENKAAVSNGHAVETGSFLEARS